MKFIIPCVILCVLSAIALGEPEPEQVKAKPEIKLDLIEPDWSLLGDGNWSPWFVDEAGETIWNPSASFNAWMDTIPQEDKAWPILVDVYYKHYELFGDSSILGALPTRKEDSDENGEDDWEQMVEILKLPETQEIIDRLNAAFAKPYMGARMQSGLNHVEYQAMVKYDRDDEYDMIEEQPANPSVMDTFPPYFGLLKDCEKFLLSHAYLLAIEGDMDGFTGQVVTLLEHQHFHSERKSVISWLVESSGKQLALNAVRWALYQQGETFTDIQLQELNRAIAETDFTRFEAIEDHLIFHDSARRVYNTKELAQARGDASLTTPLANPYEELPENIRITLSMYDMPVQGLSHSNRIHIDEPIEPQWYFNHDFYSYGDNHFYRETHFQIDLIGRGLLSINAMALGKTSSHKLAMETYRNTTLYAIAVYRHKLRHGQFPESAEAIDEDLHTSLPIDPFTGGRLVYKVSEEFGPMIYSLGNDRDDDGGRHGWDVWLGYHNIGDGDYVYFPDPYTTQPKPDDD